VLARPTTVTFVTRSAAQFVTTSFISTRGNVYETVPLGCWQEAKVILTVNACKALVLLHVKRNQLNCLVTKKYFYVWIQWLNRRSLVESCTAKVQDNGQRT
jgi:hypothetical protein